MTVQKVSDPTLPEPWQTLVDTSNNIPYYWNQTTNQTTYTRPTSTSASLHPPPPPSSSYDKNVRRDYEPSPSSNYSNNYGSVNSSTSNKYEQIRSGTGFDQSGYQKTERNGAPVNTVGFLSAEEYRRKNDIKVEGSNVPDPLQTFDSVGFPKDISQEVRFNIKASFSVIYQAA